jgi:hypothetical protein
MFSTLGIDEQVEIEQSRSSVAKDRLVLTNRTKKKTKKPRTTLNVANILHSYDNGNYSDEFDDADEVDEYFKMKLSIGNDESILKWWKDRSAIFPR